MMPVEIKVETPSVIQEIRKIYSSNKNGLLSRRGILLLLFPFRLEMNMQTHICIKIRRTNSYWHFLDHINIIQHSYTLAVKKVGNGLIPLRNVLNSYHDLSSLTDSRIRASAVGDRGLIIHLKGTGYPLS